MPEAIFSEQTLRQCPVKMGRVLCSLRSKNTKAEKCWAYSPELAMATYATTYGDTSRRIAPRRFGDRSNVNALQLGSTATQGGRDQVNLNPRGLNATFSTNAKLKD